MTIWVLLICMELIFLFLSLYCDEDKINIMGICIIVCLIILSGFRSLDTGADTQSYSNLFRMAPSFSVESFTSCLKSLFLQNEIGVEYGYVILEMVLKAFGLSYRVLLIAVAVVFHVFLWRFIKENSDEPIFSLLIYTCLLFTFFGLTGIRQTIATIPAVLIGTRYIKERSLIKFLLMICVGFVFHRSVIVFLPFYWLANTRESRNKIIISVGLFALIFVFRTRLITIITSIIGYEQYATQYDGAGTYTFTALCLLITFWVSFSYPRIEEYQGTQLLTHSIEATLFMLPFTFIDPSILRAVQYYYLYLAFLIPRSFFALNEQSRRVATIGSAVVLSLLFLIRVPVYKFM